MGAAEHRDVGETDGEFVDRIDDARHLRKQQPFSSVTQRHRMSDVVDVRKIATGLTALANEKAKVQREQTKGKKKVSKKPNVQVSRDEYDNMDEYNEYDDFI